MEYLNPKSEPKEVWLLNHAARFDISRKTEHVMIDRMDNIQLLSDHYVICMINNGSFRAAAVCKTIEDVKKLADDSDPRDRLWFAVKKTEADPEIRAYNPSTTQCHHNKTEKSALDQDYFYKCFLETFCQKMKDEHLSFNDQQQMLDTLLDTRHGFVTTVGLSFNLHHFLNTCDISNVAGLKNTYCQYTGESSASGAAMDEFVDLIFDCCYEQCQYDMLTTKR